jgi:hypothetical protein
LLAATVANSVPRPRGSKALKPEDFLPKTNVRASGLTSRQEHELKERAKRNRKK